METVKLIKKNKNNVRMEEPVEPIIENQDFQMDQLMDVEEERSAPANKNDVDEKCINKKIVIDEKCIKLDSVDDLVMLLVEKL
ncbi:hypothetical protein AgCh_038673 [Apium graveolens]